MIGFLADKHTLSPIEYALYIYNAQASSDWKSIERSTCTKCLICMTKAHILRSEQSAMIGSLADKHSV